MSTSGELFTIGQLATRTGVPARTIRFWSDAGLVPPAGRSASGYRLYDADAAARLELVSTLRELGLGLDVVQAVLSRARTVAEVAAAHVAVLDVQIRTLRLRRAVLSTVERYWQLLAILDGQPVPPSVIPAFDWLIAALRAGLTHGASAP
jgi:DNA-binding transcriptional MerR regulator